MGSRERPVEEGLLTGHEHRAVGDDRQHRNEHPGQEAGLTHLYLLDGKALLESTDARDLQAGALDGHLGTQFPGRGQGRLVVPAGRIAGKMRGPVGQGRRDDRPLGETLGGRHLDDKTVGICRRGSDFPGLDNILARFCRRTNEAEAAVHSFTHFGGGPLAGGGGLFGRQAGIGERCPLMQGFQAGFPAFGAHAEGHERSGIGLLIEVHHGVHIGLTMGCGDDFHHVGPEPAGLLQSVEQRGVRRGTFEIMERTDEHRPVLLAGLTDPPAHHRRSLDLQVHIFRTGLDGLQKLVFSEFLGGITRLPRLGTVQALLRQHLARIGQQTPFTLHAAGHFRNPAGRDERHVGSGEQRLDLLFVQIAEIQPDFRHLHLAAIQNLQYSFQRLSLYGCTDHILFSKLTTCSTDSSRMMTEPMRSARTKWTRPPPAFLSLSIASARRSGG